MADFKLFHNNPNQKNLKDFSDFYKIRLNKDFSLKDFFNHNKDVIFNQLSQSQLVELSKNKGKSVKDLTSNDIDENIILPCPCHLFIDEKYVNYSLATKHTNFQTQEINFIAFANEQIKKITSEKNSYFNTNVNIEKFKPGCRVIGWFKSLYYSGKKGNSFINNIYDSSSNFIDLTPFITQMNMGVNNSGGNFSISLPHIPVYSSSLKGMDIRSFRDNINSENFIDKDQMSNFFINGDKNEMNVKSNFHEFNYFEWLIQHNDLLFISFQDMEELTNDNLSGHNFDMIALVDNVTVNRNSANSVVSVTVTGRDLMKLITDDASIFFPMGGSSSSGRIFDNTETTIKGGDLESVMRFKGTEKQNGTPRQPTGSISVFAEEPNDFSIDFVIKTIISHLANFSIVPDDLFVSWGLKRTKFSDYRNELITGFARGIWQITKLLMDSDVANLRIHDAATSIQSGSLVTFFNKICQQPFVEFMGDTFGDQYYFIVRKPPFNKTGMLNTLISQGLRQNNNSEVKFGDSMYDIKDEDIISTNLYFDSQNIYSWYQFYPIYEMGMGSDFQYMIPAVMFPEYAAIYGSRDLSLRSQYRNFNKSFIKDELNEKNKSEQGDSEIKNSIHDLKNIIEVNAYNPFTRTGTIQIVGNRRIKRGMFVRIFSFNSNTPEIFYVDAVNHDYSITSNGVNRTTTLSVSHGMIEKYIFDEEKNYFNIIDFGDYEKSKNKLTMDSWLNIISSWKVNSDVFSFFLRKMQFLNINSEINIVV